MPVPPSLFDSTIAQLSYGLDGLSARQSLISNNIANVDTPGYLTQDIPFEQSLQSAMQQQADFSRSTASGVPASLPSAITRTDLRMRNDGNNVDVNMQMTEMARTTLTYQSATQMISQKFALLTQALAPVS